MNASPTGSFLRFTIGFLVFISMSFGLTYAVSTYTVNQARVQEAAAAAAMIGK